MDNLGETLESFERWPRPRQSRQQETVLRPELAINWQILILSWYRHWGNPAWLQPLGSVQCSPGQASINSCEMEVEDLLVKTKTHHWFKFNRFLRHPLMLHLVMEESQLLTVMWRLKKCFCKKHLSNQYFSGDLCFNSCILWTIKSGFKEWFSNINTFAWNLYSIKFSDLLLNF